MKTFKEYLKEKHQQEELDEGFLKKAGTAALLAGALVGGYKGLKNQSFGPARSQAASIWDEEEAEDRDEVLQHQKDLLSAAKRAGVPQSQWNNLKGEKIGGVVVVVNGKKVPLTQEEKEEVSWAQNHRSRMKTMNPSGYNF